jgi:hypothetical protein
VRYGARVRSMVNPVLMRSVSFVVALLAGCTDYNLVIHSGGHDLTIRRADDGWLVSTHYTDDGVEADIDWAVTVEYDEFSYFSPSSSRYHAFRLEYAWPGDELYFNVRTPKPDDCTIESFQGPSWIDPTASEVDARRIYWSGPSGDFTKIDSRTDTWVDGDATVYVYKCRDENFDDIRPFIEDGFF